MNTNTRDFQPLPEVCQNTTGQYSSDQSSDLELDSKNEDQGNNEESILKLILANQNENDTTNDTSKSLSSLVCEISLTLNSLSHVKLIYDKFTTFINFQGYNINFKEYKNNVYYFSQPTIKMDFNLALEIKSDRFTIKTNILNAKQRSLIVSGEIYFLKESLYTRMNLNYDHQWVNKLELIIDYESEIDETIKNLANSYFSYFLRHLQEEFVEFKVLVMKSSKQYKNYICERDFIDFVVKFIENIRIEEINKVTQYFKKYSPPMIIRGVEMNDNTKQFIKNFCIERTHSNIIRVVDELMVSEEKIKQIKNGYEGISASFSSKKSQIKIDLLDILSQKKSIDWEKMDEEFNSYFQN